MRKKKSNAVKVSFNLHSSVMAIFQKESEKTPNVSPEDLMLDVLTSYRNSLINKNSQEKEQSNHPIADIPEASENEDENPLIKDPTRNEVTGLTWQKLSDESEGGQGVVEISMQILRGMKIQLINCLKTEEAVGTLIADLLQDHACKLERRPNTLVKPLNP